MLSTFIILYVIISILFYFGVPSVVTKADLKVFKSVEQVSIFIGVFWLPLLVSGIIYKILKKKD